MANLEIPNHKSQTPNKFQLPKSKVRNILLVIWALELGIYLKFGLPARSPAMRDEGRCLGFGAHPEHWMD